METYGIEKYGISGTTEIVHNPSYEMLYEEEPKPAPAVQDDTIERPARKIARFDDAPEIDASAGMADAPDEPDDKK